MEKSQNLISLIALMVALFFAGSMVIGTCNRTRYLRHELKEIHATYDAIHGRIDSINLASQKEQTDVLKKIEGTYANLDSLRKLKSKATTRINTIRRVEQAKPAGVSGFNLK
jgi:hypothetical protein